MTIIADMEDLVPGALVNYTSFTRNGYRSLCDARTVRDGDAADYDDTPREIFSGFAMVVAHVDVGDLNHSIMMVLTRKGILFIVRPEYQCEVICRVKES